MPAPRRASATSCVVLVLVLLALTATQATASAILNAPAVGRMSLTDKLTADAYILTGESGLPASHAAYSMTIPQNSINLLDLAAKGGSTAPISGDSVAPEPGTILMAGIGLIALGLIGRRK